MNSIIPFKTENSLEVIWNHWDKAEKVQGRISDYTIEEIHSLDNTSSSKGSNRNPRGEEKDPEDTDYADAKKKMCKGSWNTPKHTREEYINAMLEGRVVLLVYSDWNLAAFDLDTKVNSEYTRPKFSDTKQIAKDFELSEYAIAATRNGFHLIIPIIYDKDAPQSKWEHNNVIGDFRYDKGGAFAHDPKQTLAAILLSATTEKYEKTKTSNLAKILTANPVRSMIKTRKGRKGVITGGRNTTLFQACKDAGKVNRPDLRDKAEKEASLSGLGEIEIKATSTSGWNSGFALFKGEIKPKVMSDSYYKVGVISDKAILTGSNRDYEEDYENICTRAFWKPVIISDLVEDLIRFKNSNYPEWKDDEKSAEILNAAIKNAPDIDRFMRIDHHYRGSPLQDIERRLRILGVSVAWNETNYRIYVRYDRSHKEYRKGWRELGSYPLRPWVRDLFVTRIEKGTPTHPLGMRITKYEPKEFEEVVEIIARENPINPMLRYYKKCHKIWKKSKWRARYEKGSMRKAERSISRDGSFEYMYKIHEGGIIPTVMEKCFSVDGDKSVTREMCRIFFTAQAYRATSPLSPKSKYDHMLTLIGNEGVSKSTWFDSIPPEPVYITETLDLSVDDQKWAEQLVGKFIGVVSEGAGLKATANKIKARLTKSSDHLRLPFRRDAETLVYRAALGAAVNDPEFIPFKEGSRRFFPNEVSIHKKAVIEKNKLMYLLKVRKRHENKGKKNLNGALKRARKLLETDAKLIKRMGKIDPKISYKNFHNVLIREFFDKNREYIYGEAYQRMLDGEPIHIVEDMESKFRDRVSSYTYRDENAYSFVSGLLNGNIYVKDNDLDLGTPVKDCAYLPKNLVMELWNFRNKGARYNQSQVKNAFEDLEWSWGRKSLHWGDNRTRVFRNSTKKGLCDNLEEKYTLINPDWKKVDAPKWKGK